MLQDASRQTVLHSDLHTSKHHIAFFSLRGFHRLDGVIPRDKCFEGSMSVHSLRLTHAQNGCFSSPSNGPKKKNRPEVIRTASSILGDFCFRTFVPHIEWC